MAHNNMAQRRDQTRLANGMQVVLKESRVAPVATLDFLPGRQP